MNRLLNYVPLALVRTMEKLREKHPDRVAQDVKAASTVLDRLRQLLRNTTPEDIPDLAAILSPVELRSAIHLLLEAEFRPKALELLRSRPRRDVMTAGWRFLLARYPLRELEALIKEWTLRFGCGPLSTPEYAGEQVARWYAHGTIDLGLMKSWEQGHRGRNPDVEEWLGSMDLARFDGLAAHVVMWMLTICSPETLARLEGKGLVELAEEQVRDVQAGFSRHYLCDLRPSERWNERVMSWIVKKWGKPTASEIQNAFWRSIPRQIRDEVRSWQALHELRSLLERFNDPHGRFNFWEPFVRRFIRDFKPACRDPYTGQFAALCMEFDGWGAIEFGPVGNATYLYPLAVFREMSAQVSTDPAEYKDLQRTIEGGPERDGRIIHRAGWQDSNRTWIQRLIAGGR